MTVQAVADSHLGCNYGELHNGQPHFERYWDGRDWTDLIRHWIASDGKALLVCAPCQQLITGVAEGPGHNA